MSKTATFVMSSTLWLLGSIIIALLHNISATDWMDMIIALLILIWGAVCFWLYKHFLISPK